MTQRLKQLDRDVAKATADANQAWHAYHKEKNRRKEFKLEKRWQQFLKTEESLRAERIALAAQLTGPGVHTPLLLSVRRKVSCAVRTSFCLLPFVESSVSV